MRQLEGKRRSPLRSASPAREHSSMRDMEPLHMPDEPDDDSARIADTPRRRPSRIPLHCARPPPRPPSAHSVRSARSGSAPRKEAPKSAVPVRRSPNAPDPKVRARSFWNAWFFPKDSGS